MSVGWMQSTGQTSVQLASLTPMASFRRFLPLSMGERTASPCFCKRGVKMSGEVEAPFAIAPDDLLAQPTRASLFSLLGELKRPVGTVELAERLDLHPNGVRIHLERMEQAGLVGRARDRQSRARPRGAWTIAPDAQPAVRRRPPTRILAAGWPGRSDRDAADSAASKKSAARSAARSRPPARRPNRTCSRPR
jgi:DNA-binding transcriptional ArsR family regulator